MAGNAIAWKDDYSQPKSGQREGWLVEAWHMMTAFRLMVVADRLESQEQTKLMSRR